MWYLCMHVHRTAGSGQRQLPAVLQLKRYLRRARYRSSCGPSQRSPWCPCFQASRCHEAMACSGRGGPSIGQLVRPAGGRRHRRIGGAAVPRRSAPDAGFCCAIELHGGAGVPGKGPLAAAVWGVARGTFSTDSLEPKTSPETSPIASAARKGPVAACTESKLPTASRSAAAVRTALMAQRSGL